jgi:uncharacterized protein YdaT
MPWNPSYFPAAMRHLDEPTRSKAIEIANALLTQGLDEGKAIRIAIAKAKQWIVQHGGNWTSPAFVDIFQLPVRSCSNASGLSWSR